jgi:hypothetical protein
MRATLRRLAISAAVSIVAAAGVTALDASPAAAGTCSWHWSDRDPGSEQVVNRVSGFSGIALKDGPQPYCNVLTRVPWGHWVALDCYVTNEQNVNGVTSWSHVRYGNGGPVYEGWISDYHLSNRGSNYAC